ncbi:MAG: hypothetical protein IJ711_11820 [Lachnospiraceae bacterium]|nr:hypothetical protein [Lachnospiraceae bacterium]
MEKLAGVFETKKKNGEIYYRSSLTYQGRHISLQSFSDPMKAHLCYEEAQLCLKNKAITLENYSPDYLPFEKLVCLLNVRDNQLYFSTPIYMRNKYFHYYFSKDDFLLFDLDDLFYYSRHKIMRRGGHLFVADYGMQVNILSRYGIKNYAVKGRDYLFINGNESDYRYANIEIINRYHGVTRIEKNNRFYYKAAIHIVGNYLIGTYASETDAAIAYNKAVDIVHERGITKNYPVNFIDGMSPKTYAEIYSKLKVSEKLYQISP